MGEARDRQRAKRERAVKMILAGEYPEAISKKTGYSITTLDLLARNHGLILHRPYEYAKKRNRSLAIAARLFLGVPAPEIQKEFQISRQRVNQIKQILKQEGVDL